MADDLFSLSKLSQLSPSGKMKDPKEIPVGKDLARKKKGKKSPSEHSPESESTEEERGEKKEGASSGQVLDIVI